MRDYVTLELLASELKGRKRSCLFAIGCSLREGVSQHDCRVYFLQLLQESYKC